jgi:hypothetical protein
MAESPHAYPTIKGCSRDFYSPITNGWKGEPNSSPHALGPVSEGAKRYDLFFTRITDVVDYYSFTNAVALHATQRRGLRSSVNTLIAGGRMSSARTSLAGRIAGTPSHGSSGARQQPPVSCGPWMPSICQVVTKTGNVVGAVCRGNGTPL